MHIVVVPASPKTGQATIRALLDHPSAPTVTGVYRDVRRVPIDFKEHPRFRAVQGDVADARSLLDLSDSVFGNADAVATITPPLHAEANPIAKAHELAANVKKAIGKGHVKRLVYVSSVGAQLEHGTGEIRTNYTAEQALIGAAPEVVLVRCAYFMENWAMALETLEAEPPFFYSVICPADYKIPMVSVRDIGKTCAAQLLAAGSSSDGAGEGSPYVFDLHGPKYYSTQDVKQAFEDATGKIIEVKLVQDDQLDGFYAQAFKEPMAGLFTEMTRSFLPGGVAEKEMNEGARIQRGDDTLDMAVKRMLGE
ncbi:NmrA family protein [Apiospora arundinis]|uniref:NmrA family protein n=1 Tax=Apiospora arundinis TaxID=335852 RepID=A0ABR2IJC6_9PEZI